MTATEPEGRGTGKRVRQRLSGVTGIPAVRLALPAVLVAIGIIVLRQLSRDVGWSELRTDIAATSPLSLLVATGWMLVSFAALGCYDLLATRQVAPGRVPPTVALVTGAGGGAISNLLGFAYLTGSAFRYRVYAALGLDLAGVGAILAMAWAGFWIAIALILGGVLILQPVGLSALLPFGSGIETGIGVVLLGLVALAALWLATGRRSIRLGRHALALPPVGQAALLVLAGLADMLGAAMVLWTLLPDLPGLGFPWFIIAFVFATALGILSHAPGGIGVFEATLLTALGASGRSDVLAALLLYRLIYTLLPFVLSVAGLAVTQAVARRAPVTSALRLVYRLAGAVMPPAAAGVALLSGMVLLLSGSLPGSAPRLQMLREVLPLGLTEASHLAASITGILLVVMARGLFRRLFRAWLGTMILLVVGIAASLVKGLDWEEALVLLLTLAVMLGFRGAFYRAEPGPLLRLGPRSLAAALALTGVAIWIGLLAYERVDYRVDLWWEVAWSGNAPRFLRAELAVLLVLAAIMANSLIFSRGRPSPPEPIPDAVRRLVAKSPDSEAGIALLGDKLFLLDPEEKAFLAYADTGRTLIAKGDPVGCRAAGADLIWRLREEADRRGRRCAFYGVSTAYLPSYLDLGLKILKIGETASIALADFTLDGSARKDFRHARSRAGREGLVFEMVPSAEVPAILPDLRRVSDAWLASKQGEEKGFSLGAFDEDYISNFEVAVMRRGPGGEILAFANLMSGGKEVLSVDLMRFLPGGPGCAMDALFAEVLLWAKANGFARFSLGAAPLSGLDTRRLAPLWSRVGGFVHAHGDRFYNFEGLRAFKQKFSPDWTPIYLACPSGMSAPSILYEVNILVSGGLKGLLT